MTPTKDEPDRRQDALLAALFRNRGELDATALARLLGLLEQKPPLTAE